MKAKIGDSMMVVKLSQSNFSDFDPARILATEKAEKFFSKWLAEYGDDSIAELGGVHTGIENISVLATKAIEDRRLGVSPLEKSTRYVRFDDKDDGKYKYYSDKSIKASKHNSLYEKTMVLLFDTYAQLLEPMMEFFRKKFPKPEEVSDKAYDASIRAKACDTLRGLLPLSTLTNMGVFANGRAYEYMLTKMFSNQLTEVNEVAESMYQELDKVIHNFIERIKTEKGENYIHYLNSTQKLVEQNSFKLLKSIKEKVKNPSCSVKLLDYEVDAENKLCASILFSSSDLSYKKLIQVSKKIGKKKRAELIKSYVQNRNGRWNKVGRAFEEPYYMFEIISDFGAYKDLERHRVLTQDKQLFTCNLGYDVPVEIKEAKFENEYRNAMDFASNSFNKISKDLPIEAQYVVTHGFKVRYRMKMNLREAFHLCELRSSPQGHPGYRFIAQEMYKRIKEVHPIFGECMKYVNMTNPGLERLSAEVRKEEKLKKLHS
jgi:thymidylate synthase ThyX